VYLGSGRNVLEDKDLTVGDAGELGGDDYREQPVSFSRPVHCPAQSIEDHYPVEAFGYYYDGGVPAHEQAAFEEVLLLVGETYDGQFGSRGPLAGQGIVAGLELGDLGVGLTGLLSQLSHQVEVGAQFGLGTALSGIESIDIGLGIGAYPEVDIVGNHHIHQGTELQIRLHHGSRISRLGDGVRHLKCSLEGFTDTEQPLTAVEDVFDCSPEGAEHLHDHTGF